MLLEADPTAQISEDVVKVAAVHGDSEGLLKTLRKHNDGTLVFAEFTIGERRTIEEEDAREN